MREDVVRAGVRSPRAHEKRLCAACTASEAHAEGVALGEGGVPETLCEAGGDVGGLNVFRWWWTSRTMSKGPKANDARAEALPNDCVNPKALLGSVNTSAPYVKSCCCCWNGVRELLLLFCTNPPARTHGCPCLEMLATGDAPPLWRKGQCRYRDAAAVPELVGERDGRWAAGIQALL